MSTYKLSIIIPVYNEAAHITELLFCLQNNLKYPARTQILVVDGGSTDATHALTQNFIDSSLINMQLLKSNKGRGRQMNFGTTKATGDVLYFLHADSYPPKFFDELICSQLDNNKLAGCFKMKFDRKHWWLGLAAWFTQFNVKFFRGGDQSLFIQKELFKALGGFPESHIIFEDFSLIRKLYKHKQFTVIQKWITSSSRRYTDNGIAKLQYHYWVIYLKKWCGVSTEDLVIYYKKNIK